MNTCDGKSDICDCSNNCCVCVSVISTVNADKLDKHLKKCNSRQKPRAVSLIQLRKCGRFGDLCVSCDCCVLVCLQVYYVENINSGSADMDEVVQQVNHYSHASQGNQTSQGIYPF